MAYASTAERTETATISLELTCSKECAEFAYPLYRQLSSGYDVCSVLRLPDSLSEWRAGNRTARKRADRAQRRGYRFVDVARHERADEVHAINTSAETRQGRPMSSGYHVKPSTQPDPAATCPTHGVHPYGVEDEHGTLVAYLWIYRAGDLALVSQILGHADHLEHEVMYLLWAGMIGRELREPGFVVYNRADSGTDGLRFYKERVGLAATHVTWTPA